MSWKIGFLIGIILALSPFNLNNGKYTFIYSLLGYGLILLSFLYKQKNKKDILTIINLCLIILCGLLNLFNFFSLFEITFFIFTAISLFIDSKNIFVRLAAYLLIGISGFCFPILIFNCLGFNLFTGLLNAIYYVLFFVLILITAFEFKNIN